ncbi:sugar ABC transporter [Paenibacillus sp. UMB7766-LJ446]|uniref:extracellular solute-binding protein n=1 Tax=Paenibacillus sp. UMB7766-LJ446 TaxID=3046313 RepID=UPI00254B6A01|nr:sugar ABC transporter [Paenibacillus sp. UMB7766-LJ446]MDK8189911.1 sugar ABC transporter [Paenibacillus sp. UMB7766-LJ446]
MQKKKSSKFAFLTAVTLLVALLSACSSYGNQSSEQAATDPAQLYKNGYSAPFENGKYTEPVKMTTYGCYGADTKFKNSDENYETNNPATKWFKDHLGIDIQYVWTSLNDNGACNTKMTLAIASGEELPDVVAAGDPQIVSQLIETGQFMDVSEVFNKFASEKYKAISEKYPEIWLQATMNGTKYGIPLASDPYGNDNTLYIRDDWMKKFNLSAPKTLDDLSHMLDVFTNQDPDGNGKKDSYGLSIGTKDGFVAGFASTDWIFGAYGTIPETWMKGPDGSLHYGSIQPGAKQALATLRDWYQKGYIDPEIAIHDSSKAAESVTSGKTGVISGPYWLPIWPLPDLTKNVPGATIAPYPLPVGPDGKAGRTTGKALNNIVLINKKYSHPDAVMVLLNKGLENSDRDKGSDVEFGFQEGYDYTLDNDGKPMKSNDIRFDKMMFSGFPQSPDRNLDSLAYLSGGGAPRDSFDLANMTSQGAFKPAAVIQSQLDAGIKNEFMGSPTPTMKEKKEALRKMELEVYTKIIYGKEPIEAFDDFVAKWKSSGGDQITQEVNDWYKAAMGK